MWHGFYNSNLHSWKNSHQLFHCIGCALSPQSAGKHHIFSSNPLMNGYYVPCLWGVQGLAVYGERSWHGYLCNHVKEAKLKSFVFLEKKEKLILLMIIEFKFFPEIPNRRSGNYGWTWICFLSFMQFWNFC